jgi:Flp pilus assembly protein protease CpaA
MMIGYLIVAAAVIGTGYAAYRDLLTTEVSDSISFLTVEVGLLLHTMNAYVAGEIPATVATIFGVYLAGMAVWTLRSYVEMRRSPDEGSDGPPLVAPEEVGLIVFIAAVAVLRFSLGGLSTLWIAVVSGLALFAFGQVLYHLHIWGGADSRILGAMGFALPYLPAGFEPMAQAPWAFQATLVLNLFLIGAVYVLGVENIGTVRERARTVGGAIAGGVGYGVLTTLLPVLVMPLWLTAVGFGNAPPFPNIGFPATAMSAVTHVVYAVPVGIAYYLVAREG